MKKAQAGQELPLFTVFTPTYNRSATLTRLFRSINVQSFRDFEWLIVDDGSSDDTAAEVAKFAAIASFPLRYVWQPNGGKHTAINRGAALAAGKLFLTIDSDDELMPTALEIFNRAWSEIPIDRRSEFAGVTARCIDAGGKLVGAPAPHDVVDSDSARATFILGMTSERIGIIQTAILKKHPFPTHLPTKFIPEGRLWLELAQEYKTRFIEEPARVFHDHGEPRLSQLNRGMRAYGDYEYYRFALQNYVSWWPVIPKAVAKFAVGLRRAELHLDFRANRDGLSKLARAGLLAASPLAAGLYIRDMTRLHGRLGCAVAICRTILRGKTPRSIARAIATFVKKSADSRSILVYLEGEEVTVKSSDDSYEQILFAHRSRW
ncbi:glycosyltransferase family 2 protein [Qipengyuania atrilutea]|uniref:Glycosyltransferase family 2 protein n=1 Tax=Qipengyuania atrilutea TaxID=2744473 RepID=A0A850H2I0_9SPHN|nr:glycosyltransferase family 2 protein [Actirhodobacter atriluteus]NVD44402.1 glycosyltransferase family 2 protein [Actirhodobacter atriluteus]